MKEPVGFIGLGNIGLGMARNLLKAGFPVIVFDLREGPLREAAHAGARVVRSPREVAEGARTSFIVVLNFDQVEEVIFGPEGMKEGLRMGDAVIVSSTIAPSQIESLGKRLEALGVRVLDAPVSGGKEGAAAGSLTIMVGGEKELYEKCLAHFQAVGENIYYLGKLGNGLSLKLVNNLLVCLNNLAVAEAMVLGTKAGLDPKILLEVIPRSAGDSWMFRHRAYRMAGRDFASRGELDILLKDMGYILEMAKSLKVPLPMSAVAKEIYQMAQCLGYGKEDDSAVVKVLETVGGVEVGGGAESPPLTP